MPPCVKAVAMRSNDIVLKKMESPAGWMRGFPS